MTVSMTGFAAAKGQGAGHSWTWDIRSVNGKGLDLRLRVPDWIDGLEQALRSAITAGVGRGNVSLSLKLLRDGSSDGAEGMRVNPAALSQALAALGQVETAAMARGVTLATATAADVLALRGVLETQARDEDTTALRGAILHDLPALLAAFNAMRGAEGAALNGVIAAQLDRIDTLHAAATQAATARHATAARSLQDALARLRSETTDPARLAQELALLAVRQDITEELDRLAAHIAAARSLLSDPAPVGRKFDFLVQEFMREANTLCAKAQSITLTRIGLDLKTVIDQMREQVQNVE